MTPIHWLAGDDPEMTKAINAAQRSFTEFARHAELERNRVVPAFVNVSVKAFFPIEKNPDINMKKMPGEHMFVTDVSTDGETIRGILNSDPANIPWLKEGQSVSFPVSRLSDWFLVPANECGIGGFTIDVMKQQMSSEDLQEYEQYPPLKWYRHRVGETAMDELKQIPACSKCQKREILGQPYSNGVCSLCTNGLERCECEKCGAPLFRSEDQPHVCADCGSQRSRKRRSESSDAESTPSGMNFAEKIYTGLVVAVAVLLLLTIVLMMLDQGQPAGRPMMIGIASTMIAVLGITVGLNMKQDKLATVPTIFQLLTLFFSCLGIPIAVFGLILLVSRK